MYLQQVRSASALQVSIEALRLIIFDVNRPSSCDLQTNTRTLFRWAYDT